MKKTIFSLIFILFPILSQAQYKKVDVGDVYNFGDMFLGQNVQMIGIIKNAYGCQLPSNKGNRCLEIQSTKNASKLDSALIKENHYSFEQYKDWIDNKKILIFSGLVELREGGTLALPQTTKSPALILRKIEPAQK